MNTKHLNFPPCDSSPDCRIPEKVIQNPPLCVRAAHVPVCRSVNAYMHMRMRAGVHTPASEPDFPSEDKHVPYWVRFLVRAAVLRQKHAILGGSLYSQTDTDP